MTNPRINYRGVSTVILAEYGISKLSDLAIKTLPFGHENGKFYFHGAVKVIDEWQIVRFDELYSEGDFTNFSSPFISVHAVAYPIDPRMTRADIDGATRIFANADNTGWLFGHSHEEHHKDHEILLMAGIDAVMQPYFRQLHVDVITGGNLSIKQRATDLYALLGQFYGEVIAEARKNARAKHLGERHKGVGAGHIHSEIVVAYEAIKAKWKTDKAADATKLAGAFLYIDGVLAIPTHETRWDKAARLAAEAKKKAAEAAAEETTQTTPSGD